MTKQPTEQTAGTASLVERLRAASQGVDEWRVQANDTVHWIKEFSASNFDHPEEAANLWLLQYRRTLPDWVEDEYEVKFFHTFSQVDRLMQEAADALEKAGIK